jgi:hypothetical protein
MKEYESQTVIGKLYRNILNIIYTKYWNWQWSCLFKLAWTFIICLWTSNYFLLIYLDF